MQAGNKFYDVGIAGGGIAGLSLAILLSRAGRKVIVFEKHRYPFHRVCGEYVSMESAPFLERSGIEIKKYNLPVIKKLVVSSPGGTLFSANMKTGGFGISRYLFDNLLKECATGYGATILDATTVEDIRESENYSTITTRDNIYTCSVIAGAYGKRSRLGHVLDNHSKKGNTVNYVGVKYHVEADLPKDVIELHNFKNGYCGISAVEENRYCMCYLTTAENLRISGNSIEEMESTILEKNPFLSRYLRFKKLISPVVISQINFDKKLPVSKHALMIGDAAGLITPLCGNGMSMAMNAAVIAAPLIDKFLSGKINRRQMEEKYSQLWNKNFSFRLSTGRMIQSFFGDEKLTGIFIKLMNTFPLAAGKLIESTHGRKF